MPHGVCGLDGIEGSGAHLQVVGNGDAVVVGVSGSNGVGAPVVAGLRGDDDEVLLDEAKVEGGSASSFGTWCGVGGQMELLGLRRDPKVAVAAGLLRNKKS